GRPHQHLSGIRDGEDVTADPALALTDASDVRGGEDVIPAPSRCLRSAAVPFPNPPFADTCIPPAVPSPHPPSPTPAFHGRALTIQRRHHPVPPLHRRAVTVRAMEHRTASNLSRRVDVFLHKRRLLGRPDARPRVRPV